MTISRRLILDNLKTTLEGIDGTGNYSSTVDHVHRHMRTFNEVIGDRPVICIVPMEEEYEHNPGQQIRVIFSVELLCFISAASEDARINALNDLLDDLFIALYADPTRGGYAHETQIVSTITDEADAVADYGQQAMRVALQIWYMRTTGVSS